MPILGFFEGFKLYVRFWRPAGAFSSLSVRNAG
jgi:hypothetical protein